MATRTGLKTGSSSTFVCGQIVDDAVLNNLSDLAASMRERGETVICQAGTAWPGAEEPILVGRGDNVTSETFVSLSNTWRFENAGYSKFVLDISFVLHPVAYSPGADDTFGYTRILIQHIDKSGGTADLWDSEVVSPTRSTLQTDTITGTFSNPPSSGQTEIEQILVTVESNRSATSNPVAFTYTQYGLVSICLKLHDDI